MPKKLFQAVLLVLASLLIPSLSATTLQKLTFEDLVQQSGLIVEGKVVSVYSFETDQLVYTRVVMNVLDVLKGEDPGEFIELDFLGGVRDGRVVAVSGQDIPSDKEHGFYFIQDLEMQAVNPLTGWSQGHFRIRTDLKGRQVIETDIDQELVELSDSKQAALAAKLRNMKFSSQLLEEAYYAPVTPDELRQAVGGILGGE